MSDPLTTSIDEAQIREVVTRLARQRTGGGYVIERAAILAAGADSAAIETWILDHAGRPEHTAAPVGGGLHAHRLERASPASRGTRRFLLPSGALDDRQDPSS
jgi:hypothetical protein